MSIKEHIIDIAKLSKNYQDYLANIKKRLGIFVDAVRPELIDSLWAKELQKRN